ncbi:AsmA family protein [Marinomonas colpomeniae]|uniref:AsmA family protein n=1 Tax=Marinomonas colpomeniae TaxID=2774408 RepID=A0ABR8NYE7_9GAMM|nr:AsmA family protein [Marinomonas colpomeniae]MBD5771075.1 AsmA family protein [Marinomonas colpomeniae]
MVWIKRLSLLVVGLIALLAVLLISVVLFVNPNNFKDELKAVALDKANVNLRLDGDIQWSFFPWLGLELEDIGVALGSDAEILQFDRAEFGLAIMPLFERKIQVDKVNLVNLKASLNKDANGQGNWQLELPEKNGSTVTKQTVTATAAAVVSDTESSSSTPVIPNLQLAELRIENAQVIYRDEQADQLINATLDVRLNDVQWDKAWPMAMDIAFTQSDLQGNSPIKANATLNANLSVFPEREYLSLDALVLSGSLESDLLPASPLEGKLSAIKVDVDLPQENLLIEGLTLSALDMNLDARIQAYQMLSEPEFLAVLSLGEFNPREVMERLNITLPDMSDNTALTKIQANISLEGNMKTITAQPISLVMDDTKIEANAVLGLSPLRWDVRIAGADLNLDRYLPTPVESKEGDAEVASNDKTTTEALEEGDLFPVELIRGLNGHVGVLFENLIVKNLKIDKIEFDSTQSNGLVKVSPLKASLYEGNVASTVSLDVRGNTPLINVVPSIDGVQIQPLLVDFMDMDNISGATFLNGELSTKGNQVDDLMASLQGDLLVDIRNGALEGTSLTKSVCTGVTTLRGEAMDDSKFGENTPFETMRFPAHIVDGQVSTPGLTINSVGLQVTGNGVVSLTESSLDYQANVSFPGSALDDACQVDEDVANLTFPILCKGLFSADPAGLCRPDFKGFTGVFSDQAKAKLKVKADAEKARLKAEFDAKKEAEEERLKEKLKSKLKDLF